MEAKKKYELTNETIEFNGTILHQIKALRSFGKVKAGCLGGWVEKEENLSQMGYAWVYSNAKVYGNAKVFGNAEIYGESMVYGDAQVYGRARVFGNAIVFGDSKVGG